MNGTNTQYTYSKTHSRVTMDFSHSAIQGLNYDDSTPAERQKAFEEMFGKAEPCPFCRWTFIDFLHDAMGRLLGVVQCLKCGATAQENQWNKREGK